ncbi:MAG TPA: DUF2339 domain-containing protein [Rubrobacteraceae bacterium]|nr:DUF2339 domain-containing protein [Rubrobacteraceae bacterium]
MMGRERSLVGRVESLEREVKELRRALRALGGEFSGSGLAGRSPESVREGAAGDSDFSGVTASERGGRRGLRLPFDLGELKDLRSGEWWLNKVGIGLLLLGVAFLFIYSVERGWIGPWMRVGAGVAIGVSLLAVGLRVYEHRRAFSQVLLGGGIGALYISGFAAHQLYSLASYSVAFSLMVAVTLLAFVLSLRGDGVALSLIGALGGLGTPFLLYDDSGTLEGLILYTCLILAGMAAVYFRKGWVSLLAVSSVGGWMVLLIGYTDALFFAVKASPDDRWALQAGVAFAWLLFWLVPVTRELLGGREVRSVATRAFAVSTPLVAFGFTALIWDLPAMDFGWISLSAAALYALAAVALRGRPSDDLPYTHALVALLFLTLAAVLMLGGDVLLFTLAAEAMALHYLARKFSDGIVSAQAHALYVVVAAWLVARLLAGASVGSLGTAEPALFNARALVDLLVIGLAFGASLLVLPRELGTVYRLFAHAAVLAWLWRELSALPGSEAYVTIAWGLYAVGLLVTGLRLDRASLARVGMATLFLVVGKLFLVDLSEVEAFWRVLLFLGFGVLFLSLSYYLRALWRPGQRSAEEPGGQDEGKELT